MTTTCITRSKGIIMHNINIWYTCVSKQPEHLYTKVFYDSMQGKNFEMNIVYVGKTQWQNGRKMLM